MSENNFVFSFLSDLFKDPRIKQRYGANMIDSLLNESRNLSYHNADKLLLADGDYGWFKITNGRITFDDDFRYGTLQSAYSQGIIQRPVCVRRVDDEYWAASSNRLIARFDLHWNFLGDWGTWGDFSDPALYGNVHKFMADEENRRLYILSKVDHIVRVFHLDDRRRLFDIGAPGEKGNPQNGKLSDPMDILKTPSGEILIACYTGGPEEAGLERGFAARYKIGPPGVDSVEYIDCPLCYKVDGRPENGDIEHPLTIKGREDEKGDYQVFVGYYAGATAHKIAVFDLNPGFDPESGPDSGESFFRFKFLYNSPAGVNSKPPFYFDLDDKYMYVASSFRDPVTGASETAIHTIDLSSNREEGRFIGGPSNSDSDHNNLGLLNQISDIYLDRDREDPRKNKIIVSDYNCEHIQQFYPDQAADRPIEIMYRKPDDYGGWFSPLNLDREGKAKVSWKDAAAKAIPTEIWRIFP